MNKHDTLLLCSTSPDNRWQLRGILEERYHLLEAGNGQQAMLLLNQNRDSIAALVLDVSTDAAQEEMFTREESFQLVANLPVIAITKSDSQLIVHQALHLGAADVIPLEYEPGAMLRRVENIVELHLHKQYLQTMVQEQANILRHSNETMVDALSSIIEYRSVESGQHILRIRHFTKILLDEVMVSCPEYGLDETDAAIISSAAALHDIGKIAIADAILMKPGPLTQEERETMKTHAITGCHILDTLGDMGDPEYLRYAHNICHYHHERWDGSGYPEGLTGDAIPICAQVVGLADVYDALTTRRVYKEAFSFDRAVNMILKGECGTFSPKLLECFKHVTDAFERLARDYADGLSPKNERFDVTLPAPSALQEENSLERIRAKYFALVHYINGLLVEVDLNRRLFHLIYNPYPEMGWLQNIATFEEMEQQLLDRIVQPEDRDRMHRFLHRSIQSFMEEDLRRMTHHFRFRSQTHPEGDPFEVTLLRVNPIDAGRRTLAVLCRRMGDAAARGDRSLLPILSDSTVVCRNDDRFTLLELGRDIPLLAGYTREELQENFGNSLMELILSEDRQQTRRSFREQFARSVSAEVEFRIRNKQGEIRWILDKSRLSVGADGQEYLNVFLSDITHTKQEQDRLSETLRRYEIILAQTENVLFEWDMGNDKITFSETWERIFGYPPMDRRVLGALGDGSYFHPDDLEKLMRSVSIMRHGSDYETMEVRVTTAWGRYLWCRIRASAIREGGKLLKIVGIIINIDAEKQAERLLQDRAERDSLTRLLNKNAARKKAEEYLSRFPAGAQCALLIIDLDNFKQVNDQYGHLFGDSVLASAGREIEKLFRNQDIVSRIGGDEFMVLMCNVNDRNILDSRCRMLLKTFQSLFRSGRYKLPLSCSIGIALSPEHGSTYYDLFRRADQALYRAKAEGKNAFRFYDGSKEAYLSPAKPVTAVNNHIDSDEEPGLAQDTLVRYAFQRLYASSDVEQSVNDILKLVGEKMNVSRVYVFENSDDNRYCSNTYEWCNQGIPAEIDQLQNISYEADIPGYEENFNEEGIFYCPDVTVLPKAAFEIVDAQGIKSMLQCAIREGGVFRGYIGFDECVEQRLWTKDQIRTLSYFSEMLSMFLLKQRQQEKALARADALSSILDNQNAWIYIIDPENCRIRYLNAKTRQLAPEAKVGMTCYECLLGRKEPCQGCPSRNILETRNASAVIHNPKFNLKVLSEATAIQWDGETACLMTCRELPQ